MFRNDCIYRYTPAVAALLLCLCAALLPSCEDPIAVDATDDSRYQTDGATHALLRSGNTSRSVISVDMPGETCTQRVYLELTGTLGEQVTGAVEIAPDLVEDYNHEHFENLTLFPRSHVTIGGNGTLRVDEWRKKSALVEIVLTRDEAVPVGKYLLPLRLKLDAPGTVAAAEKGSVLYYVVRVFSPTPGTVKPVLEGRDEYIKTLCYIELANANPLNAGIYTLEQSGTQFFDMVVLFAANINIHPEEKRPYLSFNREITHILTNRETIIKPLQDKGIKVLLGLLGNHDRAGVGSLEGIYLTQFVQDVKECVEAYGLDGIDIDDEWSAYEFEPPWTPSDEKAGKFIYEMRRAMPDKVITWYEIGRTPQTVYDVEMKSIIDYSLYPYYPRTGFDSKIGVPRSRYSPTANRLTPGSSERPGTAILADRAKMTVNGGYGLMFFYDLHGADESAFLSEASKILYGEPVVMSEPPHAKNY